MKKRKAIRIGGDSSNLMPTVVSAVPGAAAAFASARTCFSSRRKPPSMATQKATPKPKMPIAISASRHPQMVVSVSITTGTSTQPMLPAKVCRLSARPSRFWFTVADSRE